MQHTVTVTSPTSPSIRTARHRGDDWFGGDLGQTYELQIYNRSNGSILAVVTVDGKDTMSGEPGNYDCGGMVIRAHATVTIKGWRTSNEAAASFEITSVAGSYAAKTGDASNVGVVGVAIFEEKRVMRNARRPVARPASLGVTRGGGMAKGITRSAGAGTGFGASVSSPVVTTTFDRATPLPAEVHVLRYDTTANLIEAGILADGTAPNPFPANDGFCKAP